MSMYSLSWFYLYGVGGLMYAGGAWLCARAGALDFRNPSHRRIFVASTACLILFAGMHALFQFVLPSVG